jgi:hypothetical protein
MKAPLLFFFLLMTSCSSSGSTGAASSEPSGRARAESTSATTSAPAPSAATAAASVAPPAASSVVIEFNPNGPNPIDDKKLHGDAATCGKVKACCKNNGGALALGCQMAIAENAGDCAKIAPQVTQLAKELGKPPAGCE